MSFRSFTAYLLTLSVAACGQATQSPVDNSSAKTTSTSKKNNNAPAAPGQSTATPPPLAPTAPQNTTHATAGLAQLSANSLSLCKTQKSGASCFAQGRADTNGNLWVSAAPVAGYSAQDLQDAYQIPTAGGAGVTVALIEYGDYPTAEDDLAVYRQANGLKACTTANGCFRKVNEAGELLLPPNTFNTTDQSQAASAPVEDDGWALETALDLDMVSAGCPNCSILLVEATEQLEDDGMGDMVPSYVFNDAGASVNTAVALGATAISNSYGFPEGASLIAQAEADFFNHPGVSIFASTGDSGFGTFYPSTSQYVIAVGGTNLSRDANTTRGWSETGWDSGSSGCSAYTTKPTWQTDTACPNRLTSDVSAVGDPFTGVAVYGPVTFFGFNFGSGWMVIGGTSVSSPLMAGIWAAAGIAGQDASYAYANPQDFNDVTEGANGICDPKYQYECNATTGFDGPTGVGTPIGNAL